MMTLSIHRPLPSMLIATPCALSHVGELLGGELCALVGVEDLRRPVASQRLLERLDSELAVEIVRTRQESTRRDNQSIIAAWYRNRLAMCR